MVGIVNSMPFSLSGKRERIAGLTFIVSALCSISLAEPVVLNGAMVPAFVGTPIADLRLINDHGNPIPFQVDEITAGGEYICPQGEKPNADSADGKLDKQDEIVFLRDDAGTGESLALQRSLQSVSAAAERVAVSCGNEKRYVWITNNTLIPLSTERYIAYDHVRQYCKTPYYYAQFGRDRFHFIKAGVMDFGTGGFCNLTNELRVVIALRTLWGLLPITYTEDNIVCTVKRYKTGPLRLIRRGDFHLRLGLGIKASKAAVYQICYPQMVKVPVRVHLPVRFKKLFSDAYIEMTPILNKESSRFRFIVPSLDFVEKITAKSVDTLLKAVPDQGFLVSDGIKGYGWITRVEADPALLAGSGYVLRRPSKRGGVAECGFKLAIRDLPKGDYDIINWVFFSKDRIEAHKKELLSVLDPAIITTNVATCKNLLQAVGEKK